MSEYKGYGSEVIMDKVESMATLELQIAVIKEALKDQDLAKKLHGNPRFNQWIKDNSKPIIEIYS